MKNKRFPVKAIFLVINHLAIAGLTAGILIFFGYMAFVSYRGDKVNFDYEDSYTFDQTYEEYWYSAAQYINLREMLEVDGEFAIDREMELPIHFNEDETIIVKYRLEDIIRWANQGLDGYEEAVEDLQEEATEVTEEEDSVPVENTYEPAWLWKLEERFFPVNYESLEAIVEQHGLSNEESNTLYTSVQDQIHYVAECVEDYHRLKMDLDRENTNFRYFVRRGDGAVFTNLSTFDKAAAETEIKDLGRYYFWNSATAEAESDFSESSIMKIQREALQMNWLSYSESSIPYGTDKGSWDILTGVDTEFPVKDRFAENFRAFEQFQPLYNTGIFLTLISLILYVASFIELTSMAGWKPGVEEIELKGMDHWKTEIALIFFGILAAGLFVMDIWCCDLINVCFARDIGRIWLCAAIAAVAAVLSNAGLLIGWLSLVRRIKARTLWKNSIIYSLSQGIQECWDARTVTVKTLLGFGIYCLINSLLWIWAFEEGVALVIVIIFNVAAGVLLLRQAVQRQQIKEGIERIATGELGYKLNEAAMAGDERYLAQAVNNIGDGIAHAVEKSLKSERLKADLITNVSHDIKTPLTSIINYVDLLKRENIPDEKVQGYIRILDEKSQRLKTLTEDLVEASKVSSGNVKLEFAKMDFVELINQTNGEFSEKFEAKGLQLLTGLPKEPVYIRADGRRIWRVLENLYNNVAKYAMPGSRVYADLKTKDGNVTFTLKNMSEQPLNFAAEELTERFVRGDVSRTTEGSGLGLSIAKNLTELQKGTFEIYLDGDLFRVTVTFPGIN